MSVCGAISACLAPPATRRIARQARQAAQRRLPLVVLGRWARDLLAQGVADEIVAEPLGGAQRDPAAAAATMRTRLAEGLLWALELPATAPEKAGDWTRPAALSL